jgi:hypothetical protein
MSAGAPPSLVSEVASFDCTASHAGVTSSAIQTSAPLTLGLPPPTAPPFRPLYLLNCSFRK